MRKKEAAQHFESGLNILEEAINETCHSNYDSLLVAAINDLGEATRLTTADSGDCDHVYAQVWASAHAVWLSRFQHDSIIDGFFSTSAAMAALANSGLHHMDDSSEKFVDTIGYDTLDNFWRDLQQSVQHATDVSSKGIAARNIQGKQWNCFETALACALGKVDLERLWSSCVATTLYQQLNPDRPEKIMRCIAAMRCALELGEPTSSDFSSLGEYAEVVLRVASTIQINTAAFPKRISWLESLAIHYARRLQSSCMISMKFYASNPNHHNSLRNIIEASCQGSEWAQDIPLLSKLRFELLFTYGHAQHKSYLIHNRVDDLENSATFLRNALVLENPPTEKILPCKALLATVLNDLVLALSSFPHINFEGFSKLISAWREIDELTPHNANALLCRRLLELGRAIGRMYNYDFGTLAHLIEASDCLLRAAEIAKDPTLLATILFTRARVLAEREAHPDFEQRLLVGNAAFQLVKENPQLLKDQACCLGCSTHVDRLLDDVRENATRGDPLIHVQHLQDAISVLDLLISGTNEKSEIPVFMLSLATTYELLYRTQVRAAKPLDECTSILYTALDTGEAALKDMKSPRRAQSCRALLASVYDQLSRLPGQDGPLQAEYNDLSIKHYRLAHNSSGNYMKLTNALEKRYLLHNQPQDLDECISRLISQNKGSVTPKQEFYMSSQLVRLCRENDVRDKLLLAYKLVFQALRRMSSLKHTSIVRYEALVNASSSYACDAAAAALTLNDTTAAIELLEQGRGCFFAEQLPMHTDNDYVRTFDPSLARRVERTLAKIQKLTRDTETDPTTNQTSSANHDIFYEAGLRMQYDQTPNDVKLSLVVGDLEEEFQRLRMQPDYHDATQPKPFASLQSAAKPCPIAYINISQFRCDAIILQERSGSPNVLVVPLPTARDIISDLSLKMQKVIRDLGRGCRDVYPESVRFPVFFSYPDLLTPDQQVRGILKDLWNMVTRPVLEALNFVGKPLDGIGTIAESLPHICWCPTGPLASFLPLHAAGDYDLGPEHWAMSHVVSSYTPTVTSLARAQERKPGSKSQNMDILLISQPASPPTSPLRFVSKERDSIVAAMSQSRGDSRVTVLHDKAGLVADAISLLPSHSILHLACHGKQEKEDPLESAIILNDGHLKLREVIRAKLPSAELVYLSACQTATGDVNTPEESLNLAAGFLFAGYRGAVATMWSINDKDGSDVAKSFYEHLLKYDGPPAMNSALALHCSIQDLLQANSKIELIRWIPFMYFGVTSGEKRG